MDGHYEILKQLMTIVNTDMCKSSDAAIINCLDMYVKLLSNIESHPDEQKYKRIKKKSKLVSDALGGPSGGMDLLFKIGWVVRVQEFEEWIVWEGKMDVLHAALAWAQEKIVSVQQKAANAASSTLAAEKKEDAYVENLKRAVDLERKERYRNQHGSL